MEEDVDDDDVSEEVDEVTDEDIDDDDVSEDVDEVMDDDVSEEVDEVVDEDIDELVEDVVVGLSGAHVVPRSAVFLKPSTIRLAPLPIETSNLVFCPALFKV